MYASKPVLMLTMVACALANAMDTNALLSEGMQIAGVVVRDVNGVERMVDYNKVAHLIPRQTACATETVYQCSTATSATAVIPVPVSSETPGGPMSSTTVAAGTTGITATTAVSFPTSAASSPVAGSSPASSAPAGSTTAPAATGSAASGSSSAVLPTESAPTTASSSAVSAQSTATSATSSALPSNNAGSMVDTNMAAAAMVGLAVAVLV